MVWLSNMFLSIWRSKRDRISPWKTFKQWLDAHSYFSNIEIVSCGHFVFY